MNYEKFIKMSDLGNKRNQSKSYYDRLTSYITHNELLNEEQAFELVDRIESFIEQEIEEIKAEERTD
jgi:hypothetical protein